MGAGLGETRGVECLKVRASERPGLSHLGGVAGPGTDRWSYWPGEHMTQLRVDCADHRRYHDTGDRSCARCGYPTGARKTLSRYESRLQPLSCMASTIATSIPAEAMQNFYSDGTGWDGSAVPTWAQIGRGCSACWHADKLLGFHGCLGLAKKAACWSTSPFGGCVANSFRRRAIYPKAL
ncbi:hypothetical protein FQR65_LT20789 [Abscondita terminalis]|nr:hypothetical protein FQR65_LT20789 [Abscondita terminalis]